MKSIIYITGLLSAFFFLGWIISYAMGFPAHYIMVISGAVCFFIFFLPLVYFKRREHRRRMKKIIEEYRKNGKKPSAKSGSSSWKGWDLNTSPFRDRKSGVSWGGGNIHAANAERNTRRKSR